MEIYRKVRKLGEGTYGVVYEGIRVEDNLKVAMKKMKSFYYGEDIEASILREVFFLKKYPHDNIVKYLYHSPNFKYLVLEYHDTDVNKWIANINSNKSDIKYIIEKILHGLYHLHSHGIIHRDMKPENILLSYNEDGLTKVCIADLGCSRLIDVDPTCPKSPRACSALYKPPELLVGYEDYHFEIDVWSLGCILAEMITRKKLFFSERYTNNIHLDQIFTLLGKPDMSLFKNFSTDKYKKPVFIKLFDIKDPLSHILKDMLTVDFQKRPNVKYFLTHPFFRGDAHNDDDDDIKVIKSCEENLLEYMISEKSPSIHECLNNQTQINKESFRKILLDWLLEVRDDVNFSVMTYIRAQNIIDRYMCKVNIERKNYQLLGIVALYIAHKLEDTHSESYDYLIYMCDGIYDKKQFFQMELSVLQVLDMDVYFPVSANFISYFMEYSDSEVEKKKNIRNSIENKLILAVFDISLMAYSPFALCFAAVSLTDSIDISDIEPSFVTEECIKCSKHLKETLETFSSKIDKSFYVLEYFYTGRKSEENKEKCDEDEENKEK